MQSINPAVLWQPESKVSRDPIKFMGLRAYQRDSWIILARGPTLAYRSATDGISTRIVKRNREDLRGQNAFLILLEESVNSSSVISHFRSA